MQGQVPVPAPRFGVFYRDHFDAVPWSFTFTIKTSI